MIFNKAANNGSFKFRKVEGKMDCDKKFGGDDCQVAVCSGKCILAKDKTACEEFSTFAQENPGSAQVIHTHAEVAAQFG